MVDQSMSSIAIGNQAAASSQKRDCIAIGTNAAYQHQDNSSIAIGFSSGHTRQGYNSIAIGYESGYIDQCMNSIAIGFKAGRTNQQQNSISINASSTPYNVDVSDTLYIKPIRDYNPIIHNLKTALLQYDTSTNEVKENLNINIHNIIAEDASFSNLDVSGITTLYGDLLTDSSKVKIPVSYSTYSVAQGSDLSSNVTLAVNTWHDLTADGYEVTMQPLSSLSYIYLQFKVNYVCSNEIEQTISFRIKNNSGAIIFSDLSMGTLMGVTARNIYNGTFIDTTGYSSPVTYHLEYLICDDASNNLDVSSGILGSNHGNSNFVMAQELYIPE